MRTSARGARASPQSSRTRAGSSGPGLRSAAYFRRRPLSHVAPCQLAGHRSSGRLVGGRQLRLGVVATSDLDGRPITGNVIAADSERRGSSRSWVSRASSGWWGSGGLARRARRVRAPDVASGRLRFVVMPASESASRRGVFAGQPEGNRSMTILLLSNLASPSRTNWVPGTPGGAILSIRCAA
jgi:hypothetical protein